MRITGESKMSPAVSKVVVEVINRMRLREAGLTVPWNDVLIASLALSGISASSPTKISAISRLALYTPGYGGAYRDPQPPSRCLVLGGANSNSTRGP